MNHGSPKLAVFFDAENVSLKHAGPILQKLSADWDVHLRRAYGSNVATQEKILRELSITPVEVLRNANAKNAADLTLAVDAMEELCLGISDGICIVSGDSDFTRLVQRIREKGKTAIAFGNANTPASLRNACTAFYLVTPSQKAAGIASKPSPNPKSPPKTARSGEPKSNPKPSSTDPKAAAELQNLAPAMALSVRHDLQHAFQEFRASSGSNTLGEFSQFIQKQHPELHPRNFGFARLRALLARVGGFHAAADPASDNIIRLSLDQVAPEHVAGNSPGSQASPPESAK